MTHPTQSGTVAKSLHAIRQADTRSYLSTGFTSTGNKDAPRVQCVLHKQILSSSSLLPAYPRRPIETNHLEYKYRGVNIFKRTRDSLAKNETLHAIVKSGNENITK